MAFNNILKKGQERGGEISFWLTGTDLATDSLRKFDELIGEAKLNSEVRHRKLSGKKYDWQAIMAAIRDVYREASGHQIDVASPDD